MARMQRSGIESRTARLKLNPGTKCWMILSPRLSLGYRRVVEGNGSWNVRHVVNIESSVSGYAFRKLGEADDYEDANGVNVLSYVQALEVAREYFNGLVRTERGIAPAVTVADAAERYLEWYQAHRKDLKGAANTISAHILPTFGHRLVSDLTSREIKAWLEKLARAPARLRTGAKKLNNGEQQTRKANDPRARKATANRVLNIFKALLNKAFQDDLVPEDTAWRRVRGFAKVDEARIRFLTAPESKALVEGVTGDFQCLLRAALLTGARLSELTGARVQDFNGKTKHLFIAQSKSGRPRNIPLTDAGVKLFKIAAHGKDRDALLFPFTKMQISRGLREANAAAKIEPPVRFHELRHTYASHLAQSGVSLQIIAKLLGHADTRVTERHYAHLADRTLRDAVRHLPRV